MKEQIFLSMWFQVWRRRCVGKCTTQGNGVVGLAKWAVLANVNDGGVEFYCDVRMFAQSLSTVGVGLLPLVGPTIRTANVSCPNLSPHPTLKKKKKKTNPPNYYFQPTIFWSISSTLFLQFLFIYLLLSLISNFPKSIEWFNINKELL